MQNKIFQTDAKTFYREIGENQVMIKENHLRAVQKSSGKGYGDRIKLTICLEAQQGIWRKEMRK